MSRASDARAGDDAVEGAGYDPAGAVTRDGTVVAPAELSVGVLTSFCGAPVFIWLLRSRAGRTAP